MMTTTLMIKVPTIKPSGMNTPVIIEIIAAAIKITLIGFLKFSIINSQRGVILGGGKIFLS